jgi:hypothetical protein
MAIIKKQEPQRRTIDLTGPQGNAYFLLGTARKWGKQMGLDTDQIYEEMTSGNYENLIEVFDGYFGSICDLER